MKLGPDATDKGAGGLRARGLDRRTFFKKWLLVPGMACVAWVGLRGTLAVAPLAGASEAASGSLSAADQAAAALGARIAAGNPSLALALAAFAASEGARASLALNAPGALRRLATELLDAGRVGADFERGKTISVDGWLLSRSEAAYCCLVWQRARRVRRRD